MSSGRPPNTIQIIPMDSILERPGSPIVVEAQNLRTLGTMRKLCVKVIGTVQPWSRSFSTSDKHASHVIVWDHVVKAKGAKENNRQTMRIRKALEAKTISRPVLSEWVNNVNSKSNSIVECNELDPGGVSKEFVNQEGLIETIHLDLSQAMRLWGYGWSD
ncbi:hypothetical protein V6N11_080614 [Hibiscus sabdariffa]|uniref:Uncharacterized protein n=1 Tax=Hibiscus sabdariffa TaxID=183260 RepID=A0ABR2R842_9ROSI